MTQGGDRPSQRTLVIIPTYNERDNLPIIVKRVHAARPDDHVLIVDDGSPDGTGELADELSLADAIDCATSRPRRLLGLPEVTLTAGSPADVVLFDHGPETPFRVRGTVTAGRMHSPLTAS